MIYNKIESSCKGFIEAHHFKSFNETKETKTAIQDIALVCSNCHRMYLKVIFPSGLMKSFLPILIQCFSLSPDLITIVTESLRC
ncbi:MAG: HNH endonuclease [Weeksellaceae bacterium]|jgi:hypothetical protein|nr:HNH endonuclease [Weeksellaceae bacterium]